MQHALEADHVAAVSSLCTGTRSVRRIATHGAVWGLGHSLTLLVFAGTAVLLDLRFGETLAQVLEGVVGVMLILLGGHVLVRLWRARFHFHRHRHADGRAPGLDGAGFHPGASQPPGRRGSRHDCARHAGADRSRRRVPSARLRLRRLAGAALLPLVLTDPVSLELRMFVR